MAVPMQTAGGMVAVQTVSQGGQPQMVMMPASGVVGGQPQFVQVPQWELSLTLFKLRHPELQHPVTNRSKWMFLRPMGRDSTCRFKMNRYGKKKKRRDQHVGGGSQNCKVTNIAICNGNSNR